MQVSMLVGVIVDNFVAYPIDGSSYQRPILSVSSGGNCEVTSAGLPMPELYDCATKERYHMGVKVIYIPKC